MHIRRSKFGRFLMTGVTLGLLLSGFTFAQEPRKPNIVFVLADDLGWRDVGFHGAKFNETPHIDELARDGMIFNQFYSGGPNCAPTRACIMTGMYTPRHQLYTPGGKSKGTFKYMKLLVPNKENSRGNEEFVSQNNAISPEHISIAEVLKTAGYVSARIGKWHLGKDTQGFDFSTSNGKDGPDQKHYGSKTVARTMTDAAIKFISDNKQRPFFLYVAHWDVHGPHKALGEVVNKYRKKKNGWSTDSDEKADPTYAAMVEAVDTSVGRIRNTLRTLDLEQNTFFIFSSDNGGTPITTMRPLRGAKGALFEGGIRVSTCAAWPDVITADTDCDVPLTSVDLLPTFASMAGAPLPSNQPVDGTSFLPLLKGEKNLDRKSIFWHYPLYLPGTGDGRVKPILGTKEPYWRGVPATVVRQGDFKLFYFYEDKSIELYNVKTDISESQNLAATMPERASRMKSDLLAWVKKTNAPTPSTPNPDFRPSSAGDDSAAKKSKRKKKQKKKKQQQ